MLVRRPERASAVALLASLVAALLLLARPAESVSVSGEANFKVQVNFGCAGGGFVEVTARRAHESKDKESKDKESKDKESKDKESKDKESKPRQVVQIGLVGRGRGTTAFPTGGPTLLTVADEPVTVRLAGPVHAGDEVFIRAAGAQSDHRVPLGSCDKKKPLNFGLAGPSIKVNKSACGANSTADIRVTLTNPNQLDGAFKHAAGVDEIDYTVLLVHHPEGRLLGSPRGALMRFAGPGRDAVTVKATARSPQLLEVRVVGLDGAVTRSRRMTLDCSKAPDLSSSATTPVTSSTSASSTTTATRAGVSRSAIVAATLPPVSARRATTARRTTSSSPAVSETPPSVEPDSPQTQPVPIVTPPLPRLPLTEPSRSIRSVATLQKNAAIVVALTSLVIMTLVAGTGWSARRR